MREPEERMRVDVYLTRTRLIMPRQAAKRACENGIVWVNGHLAKPATSVRVGDRIVIHFTDQDLAVRVANLPGKSVPKRDASAHYEIVEIRRFM